MASNNSEETYSSWADHLEKTLSPTFARHKEDLLQLLQKSQFDGGAGMTPEKAQEE